MSTSNRSSAQETTFFLHHYEASPYAEKIRAMFGLADAPWSSVLSPPYPPRPNVDPLAGGYRRIPVAQIGADVFCDTALIATEVAELTGHREFAPQVADDDARALVQRAEGPVFFSAVTSASPLKLLTKLMLSNGPRGTMNFVRDRTAMMKTSSVRPPQGKEAARLFEEFLSDLDDHLESRNTLEGSDLTYADFSAYHPIWLGISVGSAGALRKYAAVQRWIDRMQGLGQGRRHEASPEDAFRAAQEQAPRPMTGDTLDHEALNSQVTIAPADYGKVGVTGVLAAVLDDRYVLRRETERFGEIHVHFPRAGYDVAA